MPFQDKTLTCVDCGQTFVFTVGEQEFFAQKGFQNEPKRCKGCKSQKRGERGERGGGGFSGLGSEGPGTRELHEVTCSSCGEKTTVPFRPTMDRPVYCRSCFQLRRGSGMRP